MPSYFLQAYDWKTLLFRPEARIDEDGTIVHNEECLCVTSLLTEVKACTCNIYEEESFDNQLQQLYFAIQSLQMQGPWYAR